MKRSELSDDDFIRPLWCVRDDLSDFPEIYYLFSRESGANLLDFCFYLRRNLLEAHIRAIFVDTHKLRCEARLGSLIQLPNRGELTNEIFQVELW